MAARNNVTGVRREDAVIRLGTLMLIALALLSSVHLVNSHSIDGVLPEDTKLGVPIVRDDGLALIELINRLRIKEKQPGLKPTQQLIAGARAEVNKDGGDQGPTATGISTACPPPAQPPRR